MLAISAGLLRRKQTWIAAVLLSVTTLGFGWYWYSRGEPDAINPGEKFELQFGRGSGWHGLDLLRITSDGKADYEYQANDDEWHRKRFAVGEKRLADLRAAINALDPWSMARAYHGNVKDGTQWVFLIRIDGKAKSVYFDNNFPAPIQTFSDFVDQTILEPLADPVEAEAVPARHHRKHEKEIWASIQ